MSRRHNLRRISLRSCYSAAELADTLDVNMGTIRRWCAEGLQPIERRRPFLFLGADVAAFLSTRHKPRQPLEAGEIYCVACRTPRQPLEGRVILEQRGSGVNFVGICPVSGHAIRRRVRVSEIGAKLGTCHIAREDDATTMKGDGQPHRMSAYDETAS